MTRYLPVHCCCNPDKRLGWVSVRENPMRVFPWIVHFVCRREFTGGSVLRGDRIDIAPAKVIVTTIERLGLPGGLVIDAVKSAHEPIEVWRQVPEFQEER